jgi:hypothetical protein
LHDCLNQSAVEHPAQWQELLPQLRCYNHLFLGNNIHRSPYFNSPM